MYPSTEHAYVASKSTNEEVRRYVSTLPSAGAAKRYGRILEVRPDWDKVRVLIMKEIVTFKFENDSYLRERLLATEDATIEEGNAWGDTFWGISPIGSEIGENHLGKIIMAIRDTL